MVVRPLLAFSGRRAGVGSGKSCLANLGREGVVCAYLGQSVSGNTNPLEPT